MRGSSQLSRKAEKTNATGDRNSECECCTKKQMRSPPTYQIQSVATNNFFAQLRAIPMESAEQSSEGNPMKTPETNDSPGKGRPP
jgi:hypothetical protein